MKNPTKTPKKIQSQPTPKTTEAMVRNVSLPTDTSKSDEEILLSEETEKSLHFHNSHNIMTSQPKGVMAVSEAKKLIINEIALTREACEIECEECHRKDCLRILCHADLEVIKQQTREDCEKEIEERTGKDVYWSSLFDREYKRGQKAERDD